MDALITLGALTLCLIHRQRRHKHKQECDDLTHNQNILSSVNPYYLRIIEDLCLKPPPLLLSPTAPAPLSSELSPSNFAFVDTPVALVAAVTELTGLPRLAIDIEHHSVHTYSGLTCLIQISTGQKEYLIDCIALRNELDTVLGPLLSSPAVLKVLHGGSGDVLWLLRDFNIRLLNVFDTFECSQLLGFDQRSLAALVEKYAHTALDKSLQKIGDWRQRPLPRAYIDYARADVHWLLYIADCLGAELKACSDGISVSATFRDTPLGKAGQRSQSLSLIEYTGRPLSQVAASAAAAAIMKGHIATLRLHCKCNDKKEFSVDEIKGIERLGAVVHVLCVWRDGAARKLDEGVACVLPDAVLLKIAQQQCSCNWSEPPATTILEKHLESILLNQEESSSLYCQFPRAALADIAHLSAEVHAAVMGQRPWAHPEVLAAMHPPRSIDAAALKKQIDPAALQQRLGERFGVKKRVYENCRMYSADGELLCFTDRKRLAWYLKKGLATEVDPGGEPLAVKLNFVHKDDDQHAGHHAFYSAARSNMCVVCGGLKHYLRFRVVPSCYRRALPEKFKSHRSHDVVLLCVGCHERAQREAERTKREVSIEYEVPLFPQVVLQQQEQQQEQSVNDDEDEDDGNGGLIDDNSTSQSSQSSSLHPFHIRKAALALHHNADRIPEQRREELQQQISQYVRAVEPWLHHLDATTPFDADLELKAGLLAGMAKPSRRKAIRRWLNQGVAVPQPLIAEMEGGGVEGCNGVVDLRDGLGHAWHGQQVVEKIVAVQGEAGLAALCSRFRKSFVDGLAPKHLPGGWRVDHQAPRSFGEGSAFHSSSDDNCDGSDNSDGDD